MVESVQTVVKSDPHCFKNGTKSNQYVINTNNKMVNFLKTCLQIGQFCNQYNASKNLQMESTSSSDWSWGSVERCSSSSSSSSLPCDLWDRISSPCRIQCVTLIDSRWLKIIIIQVVKCYTFRLRFFRLPIQNASWQLFSVSMAFTLYTNSSRLFFKAGTWLVRLVSWWSWAPTHYDSA